jgi:hypothetical protein
VINTSKMCNSFKQIEHTHLIISWQDQQEKVVPYYKDYWCAVFAGAE